jgi:hypothetical protein
MNHKPKALGLAFLAVVALGVLSTSTASAGEFHSEGSHSVISGSQVGEEVLTVSAGTVKCKEATYSGTQSTATATTLKVTPTYSECTAFGFVNATIDTNGCEFKLSGDNQNVAIVCPAGKAITVTAFNCEVTIVEQETTGIGVTYTDHIIGTTRHIGVSWHLSIEYIQHSKSFPGCSGHTTLLAGGTWSAESTIKCYSIGTVQIRCWRS